jgi:Flp pilus assembly pilin Flp
VRVTDKLKETSAAFAETEQGGAAMETGLLLALAAAFAFTMRQMMASPLLGVFTKATKVISQALAG